MDKRTTGLYNKFHVTRADGTSSPGEKHYGCDYFVLDVTHDKHAIQALLAYADSCEAEYPLLARDLRQKVAPSDPAPLPGQGRHRAASASSVRCRRDVGRSSR